MRSITQNLSSVDGNGGEGETKGKKRQRRGIKYNSLAEILFGQLFLALVILSLATNTGARLIATVFWGTQHSH